MIIANRSLYGSTSYSVIKPSSKSYGKGQISTPPRGGGGSETPQRISTKLRIYNYVVGMTTH